MSLLQRIQSQSITQDGSHNPIDGKDKTEKKDILASYRESKINEFKETNPAEYKELEQQRKQNVLLKKQKQSAHDNKHQEIKNLLHKKIITEHKNQSVDEIIPHLDSMAIEIIKEDDSLRGKVDRGKVVNELINDLTGYGPINPLLLDEDISEVMVNGPNQVYVERKGNLELTNITFRDDEHVLNIIEKIVAPIGRRIDESSPMVDARLPDGSRVNAIIPPLALKGPTITIRKFAKDPFVIDDLVNFGTVSRDMATFLDACVKAQLNIFVSGGTGSGKTTTLNVLSAFIPNDERIVTIEDAAELQLWQDHVISLESRPPNIEGKGAITIRDLVRNSLRMRPDRIVIGEVRGGEALDMLQAMNTGHDGSLATGHSNSPRDMISRLETMVLMAGIELPIKAIREQIAGAIDIIIQQSRLKDGSRKIVNITEVQGLEGDVIVLQDIFSFKQEGVDANGKIIGKLSPTGIRPKFYDQLEKSGIHIPATVFMDREV
ncbi:type II secretion system protein E [Desulfuribacillus stibiiarsenatis]|uniref:Type II secretion system protein E n=1 Tax=Desulfuribacillus stibiiarsenatis TaxID=1390249 RepID=A0A1E5L802_9FIRM|nr:CpaF family protein [Desulfuribacillus stibiiarsenatis]OEH86188.1 type II secretion system protein E [Desulfuribacillus stibiiarsenatis]